MEQKATFIFDLKRDTFMSINTLKYTFKQCKQYLIM